MVLCMLFAQPAFSLHYYVAEPDPFTYGLSLIHAVGPETPYGQQVFNDTIKM